MSRGFSKAPTQRHLLQEAHHTTHTASLGTESLPDRISQHRPESLRREARRGVTHRGVLHIFHHPSEDGAELNISHLSDRNSVPRGVPRPISPTATERVTRVAAQS